MFSHGWRLNVTLNCLIASSDPSNPSNIMPITVTPTSIEISWTAPPSDFSYYKVFITNKAGERSLAGRVNKDEDPRYRFQNLNPTSDYEIEVVVILASMDPEFPEQRNTDKVSRTFQTRALNNPLFL